MGVEKRRGEGEGEGKKDGRGERGVGEKERKQ